MSLIEQRTVTDSDREFHHLPYREDQEGIQVTIKPDDQKALKKLEQQFVPNVKNRVEGGYSSIEQVQVTSDAVTLTLKEGTNLLTVMGPLAESINEFGGVRANDLLISIINPSSGIEITRDHGVQRDNLTELN